MPFIEWLSIKNEYLNVEILILWIIHNSSLGIVLTIFWPVNVHQKTRLTQLNPLLFLPSSNSTFRFPVWESSSPAHWYLPMSVSSNTFSREGFSPLQSFSSLSVRSSSWSHPWAATEPSGNRRPFSCWWVHRINNNSSLHVTHNFIDSTLLLLGLIDSKRSGWYFLNNRLTPPHTISSTFHVPRSLPCA